MNFYLSNKLSPKLKMNQILKILIYFLPVSLIVGNAVLNINSFLIIINLILIFLFEKKLFTEYKNIVFIFIAVFFLILINVLFSSYSVISLISSMGILRYFFVMLAVLYCLEKDKDFFIKFTKYLFFILLFVSLDTLLQYFIGKDIFGIENTSSHGQRLNGPFGNEYVVGSYLSKLFFISLIYLILKNKSFGLIFVYLIFILSITLLTKERIASLMLIITCSLYLIFTLKINFKKKFIFGLIFFISFNSLIYFNKSIKDHLILRSLEQVGINFEADNNHDKRVFFDSRWGAHFLTAYYIFKDNILIGSGIKTFRYECGKEQYEAINSLNKDSRCNTHPHNIYLELLSETGILIFVSFCIINLFFLYRLFLNIYKNKTDDISLIILCSFLMLFQPIQTTGAFFSTWNGFYYWLVYAFVAYEFRRSKRLK